LSNQTSGANLGFIPLKGGLQRIRDGFFGRLNLKSSLVKEKKSVLKLQQEPSSSATSLSISMPKVLKWG
jgi:hypothetical protein